MIDDLAEKIQLARISADLARKSVVSEKKKIPAENDHCEIKHGWSNFSILRNKTWAPSDEFRPIAK